MKKILAAAIATLAAAAATAAPLHRHRGPAPAHTASPAPAHHRVGVNTSTCHPGSALTPAQLRTEILGCINSGANLSGPQLASIMQDVATVFGGLLGGNTWAGVQTFTNNPKITSCPSGTFMEGGGAGAIVCDSSLPPGVTLTAPNIIDPVITTPVNTSLTSTDGIYVQQSGATQQISVQTLANFFGLYLPKYDLDFADNTAFGGTCLSIAACTSVTNGGGYAQWADGHWTAFASNTIRRTDIGVLVEGSAVNWLHWSRDLTQAAWTISGGVAAGTATGVDLVANSASTLTASGSNATACQTVSVTPNAYGEDTFSVFLRRHTGTGEVDISLEGSVPGHSGNVWRVVTKGTPKLTSSWQRFQMTYDSMGSTAQACVRVTTNGDAVDVDFAQVETRIFATSPILTTTSSGSRPADQVKLTGSAAGAFNAAAVSAVIVTNGFSAGIFRHQPGSGEGSFPVFGNGSNVGATWQYGANAFFWAPGGYAAETGAPPFAVCGPTTGTDLQASMALPAILGLSWDNNGLIADCDGGGIFVGPASAPANGDWYLGDGTHGPFGYVKELRIFDRTLPSQILQQLTVASNKAVIADQVPSSGAWNDYTTAAGYTLTVGGTNPPSGGGTQFNYAIETGLGTAGITSPLQTGLNGNMIRFNMFQNNCWNGDLCATGGTGGSERSELDGVGSADTVDNNVRWQSFSMCIEPGAPITSNWLITGQIHQTINPASGSSPPFLITGKIGEFRSIQFVTDGNQGYSNAYEWPAVRGVWEHFVIETDMDPTGVSGVVNVWKDGVNVVNYNGVTGETPTSGTQHYYWKFGFYRSQSPEYSAVRYANMTYSTSSLASKVASPDSIPSGYGTTCQ